MKNINKETTLFTALHTKTVKIAESHNKRKTATHNS